MWLDPLLYLVCRAYCCLTLLYWGGTLLRKRTKTSEEDKGVTEDVGNEPVLGESVVSQGGTRSLHPRIGIKDVLP